MKFDLNLINNQEDLKLLKNQFNNSAELLDLMAQLKTAEKDKKAEIGKKIQALKKKLKTFLKKQKKNY
ncbi:hypothetical protein [Mycoplasma struthionis]|uniref:hypothetical protein n=1 Tax=Mycoplasma struthionis TaxID=538220 RepID=UPI0026C884AD